MVNPNASAKFPMRRMPLESFTELARQLLEDPEVFVLIPASRARSPTRSTSARRSHRRVRWTSPAKRR